MLRVLFLCLLWLAGPVSATPPLITPEALHALIAEGAVRVVDVREAPAYAMQHVPTAVSAPYGLWRGDADNPGQIPPQAELTELVQSLGLTPDTHAIIVYAGVDATDFGSAARAYWTLRSLGMAQLSVLDGGLAAWVAAGFDASDVPALAERSSWQPRFNREWTASRDEVLAVLGHADTLLVDARPLPYFDGRQAPPQSRTPGTLPGAVNLDSELFFELGSARLMGQDELAQEAQTLGAEPDQAIITFCNTGHWSATDWFVLSEVLGHPDVRMYPGSLVDWTNAPDALPMANAPSRWTALRSMVFDWLHRNWGVPVPG